MWRLCVLHARLNNTDVVRNVSVRSEDVEHSIEIVVEKETCKGQRLRRDFSDSRSGCFVGKQTRSIVVVKRDALIREVSDHNTLFS